MRNVITSAEPFGFGPVSKLRSVGTVLSAEGWELDFIGAGSALTYVRGERGLFRSVTELHTPADLLRVDASRYCVALSVMDPFLAVWAAHQGLPCVYVDSLFWFWGWPDQEALKRHWDTVMAPGNTAARALELLQQLPMPAAEYVGHRSASVSCVQRTPSTPSVSDAVRDIEPVVPTGAIVDRSRRQETPRDLWMVSLSGLINPLITADEAVRWASAAIRLVDQAFVAGGIPEARVCLTGNADIIDRVPDIPSRFEFGERDGGAVLELFNRAHACLTPPGLTTMLESLAYDCPVLPLPPQHYGHERILGEFSDHHADAFPQTVTAAMLGLKPTGDPAVDTRRLITSLHDQAESRSDVWTAVVAAMAGNLGRALTSRAPLLAQQRSIVDGFVGGFSGAREVVSAFEDVVNGPGLRAGRSDTRAPRII